MSVWLPQELIETVREHGVTDVHLESVANGYIVKAECLDGALYRVVTTDPEEAKEFACLFLGMLVEERKSEQRDGQPVAL